MYLSLNSSERKEIWTKRITNFLLKDDFSSDKKQILNLVKSKLSTSMFELDNKGLAEVKNLESEITPLVLKSFSKEEMKEIFASLKPINKQYKSGLKPNAVQAGCQCNGNSIWDCENCAVGGGCTESSQGCGTFLLFSCGFSCTGIPPREK